MKRIFFVAGAAGMLLLSSCIKKDWVCQCTDHNNQSSYHDVPNATLGDARTTCNTFEVHQDSVFNNCSVIE